MWFERYLTILPSRVQDHLHDNVRQSSILLRPFWFWYGDPFPGGCPLWGAKKKVGFLGFDCKTFGGLSTKRFTNVFTAILDFWLVRLETSALTGWWLPFSVEMSRVVKKPLSEKDHGPWDCFGIVIWTFMGIFHILANFRVRSDIQPIWYVVFL